MSIFPSQAERTALISSATESQAASFTMARFTTMSISSAPFRTASAASKALAAVVM